MLPIFLEFVQCMCISGVVHILECDVHISFLTSKIQ